MYKFYLLCIFLSILILFRNYIRYLSVLKFKVFNLVFSNDYKCFYKIFFY